MSNSNNLNNYAAFLTMAGGEQAALPILENLNKKFPGNSTILNNIGQAWFGLGDMNNANKYLDSAIVLYPHHSQANMTKSEIQESEGKNAEAIESVKRAIQEHYTTDKEDRVNKLGGKVKFEEIPFKYPKPWPPMGIEKFIIAIPPYPMSAGDADINDKLWRDYKENLMAARNKLSAEIEQLKIKLKDFESRKVNNPGLLLPYNNTVHNTAVKKMAKLDEWATEQLTRLYTKRQKLELETMPEWTKEYHKASNGVGCPVLTDISVGYMVKANTAWHEMNNELLTFYKEWINTKVHYLMYANSGLPDYELQLAAAKNIFLDALYQQAYVFGTVCKEQEPGLRPKDSLPDFDEVNCRYKDELFIPPFTTIKTECNKMSTEFDIDTELGVKIKLGWDEDLNSGKITKGTLELGYEGGIEGHLGPVKAELKGEGAIGIEVTQEGVKEVYIKGSATVELSGHVTGDFMDSKGSPVAELEVKSSWNAGSKGNAGTINTTASVQALCNTINIGGAR
jgi:tetratricopeptide (TPR) repeat protein